DKVFQRIYQDFLEVDLDTIVVELTKKFNGVTQLKALCQENLLNYLPPIVLLKNKADAVFFKELKYGETYTNPLLNITLLDETELKEKLAQIRKFEILILGFALRQSTQCINAIITDLKFSEDELLHLPDIFRTCPQQNKLTSHDNN